MSSSHFLVGIVHQQRTSGQGIFDDGIRARLNGDIFVMLIHWRTANMATKAPTKNSEVTLQEQLDKERRLVSFDSYDLSVRQLLDMFESGEIEVPPEYQRQFIWSEARESQLVESVLLGIPIPSLFMATNSDSTWEIVDGVQRLGTLAHFLGSEVLTCPVFSSHSFL
jgi:hypothetical protein